jgi:hypothetical protein
MKGVTPARRSAPVRHACGVSKKERGEEDSGWRESSCNDNGMLVCK